MGGSAFYESPSEYSELIHVYESVFCKETCASEFCNISAYNVVRYKIDFPEMFEFWNIYACNVDPPLHLIWDL